MSIAGTQDIPAIDAALAQLTVATTSLVCLDHALQGRGHITARLGFCGYHARREIESMRAVLLSLRRAWEGEQMQAEIAAAKAAK